MCRRDGGNGNGEMSPHWEDANLHAARHLCENVEKYRKMCEKYQSHVARIARSSDFAYILAREGRKLRNEFLQRTAA